MNFSNHASVKIITGFDCVSESAALIVPLGKKALIVSGKSSADKSGAMADVDSVLRGLGIAYVRFAAIPENPPAPLCREAGEFCRCENCDFIVAI
ncbi:MAG: iron-containing alcohol dehydrogenase, partial [Ruminococcaceae bacterium]|nr:iron-containing alcohol dehydrogenase [Oscillospiraceae bacterium]